MSVDDLVRLNRALTDLALSVGGMLDAFRSFAAAGADIKRRIERDPVWLRAWGRQWPKKERRRIGRKVKRLERAHA